MIFIIAILLFLILCAVAPDMAAAILAFIVQGAGKALEFLAIVVAIVS